MLLAKPSLTPSRLSQHVNEASVFRSIDAPYIKTSAHALQEDGISPLAVVGETHLGMSCTDMSLALDALVVEDLDAGVLPGTPFMIVNDISVHPVKRELLM